MTVMEVVRGVAMRWVVDAARCVRVVGWLEFVLRMSAVVVEGRRDEAALCRRCILPLLLWAELMVDGERSEDRTVRVGVGEPDRADAGL